MALLRRITNLFRRDTVESEIAEWRTYVDLATEADMQKRLPTLRRAATHYSS